VTDERMSDGELRHRFESIDKRFESVDKRLDRMATVDMVTSEAGHTRDKIEEVDRDSRERDKDMEKAASERSTATDERFRRNEAGKQNAWSRTLQIMGIVVAIVAAYIAAKGIK
jgi:hypothetical protein